MNLLDKYGDLDVYLASDHSQLEIRVLAQMSKDKKLISLIQNGDDLHSDVGHELTGLLVEKIKKNREIRTAIKQLHFGIIFGMTAWAVFNKLKTDTAERGEEFNMQFEEVEELYNSYFKKFKGVAQFIEEQHKFAEDNSYVSTLFGFLREITLAGDDTRGTFWANQAVNSPIQGTAHQLMLIAMAVLGMKPQTYKLLQQASMEIHDAFYVFSKLRMLKEAHEKFIHLMENEVLIHVKKWWPEVNWVVPLKAEAKAGFRLGVMVEYSGGSIEEFIENWCLANRKFDKKMKKDMLEAV
jgi:DNA polymerase I